MAVPRRAGRDERNCGNAASGEAQAGESKNGENGEVGAAGGKIGDDAVVVAFVRRGRLGERGGVGVTAGSARDLGRMKEFVRLGIGGEPDQQAQQPDGETSDPSPEKSRAAGRAGAVEAEKRHLASHHTEVVKPPP